MPRNCKTCLGKCTLLSVDCFYDESYFFSPAIKANEVRKIMNKVQTDYIIPRIGQSCCDNLCTAILNSELPDTDTNYEALSQEWEILITAATPLIVAASEYEYISKRGYGILTAQGFKLNDTLQDGKLWTSFVHDLAQSAKTAAEGFKTWIEDKGNRVNYPCLPALETEEDCSTETEQDYAGGFTTTKYRPSGYRRYP